MLTRLVRAFKEWRAASRTAEQLSDLSDEQLRDIGIVRGQIPEIARNQRILAH